MVTAGDTVVVAVSGGVDSVVLLKVLHRLAPGLSIELAVAHLDHGLRPESSEDATFVERLARELGVPCVRARADLLDGEGTCKGNLEEAARVARYAFLERVATQLDARRIAVGHTLDDRAETVLFHLARGAGLDGLASPPAVRGRIVRPLIETSRDEVLAFARREGVSWREDATNQDESLSRNRIRHRVLPEMVKVHPGAIAAIGRTAELAGEAAAMLDELLEPLWTSVSRDEGRSGHQVVLDREALRRLSPAVQRALLRRALRVARGDLHGIEQDHLMTLQTLLAPYAGPRRIDLPRATARIERDRVIVRPARTGEDGIEVGPWTEPRALGLGVNDLAEVGVRVELAVDPAPGTELSHDPRVEQADADRVAFPLFVRGRRPGDRFRPLGMAMEKKLNAFMIDEAIPAAKRDRWPLLCDQEGIIWVPGVRLADRVKVTEGTKRILRMRAEGVS
jgi:tRNA(Ile)-lysidine synthase